MKYWFQFSAQSRLAGILFLATLIAGAARVQAASTDSAKEDVLKTRSDAFTEALGALATGHISQGEAKLAATNTRKSGTAGWYFETAVSLCRAALFLRQTGQVAAATATAQQAMVDLGQAEQKLSLPQDQKLAASIKQLAGLINEQLVGTTEMARAYYRAAAQLDPDSPAVALLNKIEAADDEVAAKQKGKSGPKGGG